MFEKETAVRERRARLRLSFRTHFHDLLPARHEPVSVDVHGGIAAGVDLARERGKVVLIQKVEDLFVQRLLRHVFRFAVRPRKTAKAHERTCDAPSLSVRAVDPDKYRIAVGGQNGGHIAGAARKELLAAAARPQNDGNALRVIIPFSVKFKIKPVTVFVEGNDVMKICFGMFPVHPDGDRLLRHSGPPDVFAPMITERDGKGRLYDKNRGISAVFKSCSV